MWFKARAWIPVAWILSLANLGAVWFAARPGEAWHATTHALLALLFGVGAQRLNARWRALHSESGESLPAGVAALREELTAARQADSETLKQVQQSVDAIAIELERLGESQRFLTKALAPPGQAEGGVRAPQPDAIPAQRRPSEP
jgi:transposase-like protein